MLVTNAKQCNKWHQLVRQIAGRPKVALTCRKQQLLMFCAITFAASEHREIQLHKKIALFNLLQMNTSFHDELMWPAILDALLRATVVNAGFLSATKYVPLTVIVDWIMGPLILLWVHGLHKITHRAQSKLFWPWTQPSTNKFFSSSLTQQERAVVVCHGRMNLHLQNLF